MRPSSQACGSVKSANPSSGFGNALPIVALHEIGRHDDHELGIFPLGSRASGTGFRGSAESIQAGRIR